MPAAPVTVFGASGYLGRAVVERLRAHGVPVRAASRGAARDAPEGAEATPADVREEAGVAAALEGAAAAVNAVGLYVERGGETFEAVHVEGAARVARLARAAGVERLVLVSGIGADPGSASPYVRARAAGEARVREAFPDAVVVRPSVLFGPGDAFLAALDVLTAAVPLVPLFGAGSTRLQPVFVDDAAEAIARAAAWPRAHAPVLELGGPRVLTYRAVIERVLAHRRRRRVLVPVPFAVWSALAGALAWLPSPPITRDALALVRADNVADPALDGFAALGIAPRDLDALIARCLP